jgi:hypothetical protein
MTQRLSEIVQGALDVDFRELRSIPGLRDRAVTNIINQNLVEVLEEKLEGYRPRYHAEVAIDEWELVPRVLTRRRPTGIIIGPPAPRGGPEKQDLVSTLLYAHRMAVAEPMLHFVGPPHPDQASSPMWQAYRMSGLTQGLNFWINSYELIERDLVIFPNLVDGQGEEGAQKSALNNRFESVETFMTRKKHETSLMRLIEELYPTDPDEWFETDLDLDTAHLESAVGRAWAGLDLWLPSSRSLLLLRTLMEFGYAVPASFRLQDALTVAKTIEMQIPDASRIDLNDAVKIRLSSEIHETWRNELGAALREISQSVGNGTPLQQAELTEEMQHIANHTRTELSRLKKDSWSTQTRDLAFGALGASIGNSLDGPKGALIGSAGALAAWAGLTMSTTGERRRSMRSREAKVKFALAIAEDSKGGV